jgi:N-acetylneuraminate synthase
MSTGMATLAEINEAVTAAKAAGCKNIALLKCTSAYPAKPEEMNLNTITEMEATFGVPAGLSDHTLGVAVPIAAVALGACIVEKHITLSRSIPGPDSAFSLEPFEFKAMVDAIRITEKSLGSICYEVNENEKASRIFRRSLFAVRDIKAGEVLTEQNVRSIRPGYGLHPRFLNKVIGGKAKLDIKCGTPLDLAMIIE